MASVSSQGQRSTKRISDWLNAYELNYYLRQRMASTSPTCCVQCGLPTSPNKCDRCLLSCTNLTWCRNSPYKLTVGRLRYGVLLSISPMTSYSLKPLID